MFLISHEFFINIITESSSKIRLILTICYGLGALCQSIGFVVFSF